MAVEHLARRSALYIDGERFRKKEVEQKLQELIKPVGGDPMDLLRKLKNGLFPSRFRIFIFPVLKVTFKLGCMLQVGWGGRGKTWVYLEKGDADAEWEIEELHTGGEDDPEIYWQVKEEYKRLD